MAIAMASILRPYSYQFFFARELKWAIQALASGRPVPPQLRVLIELGIDPLHKFPDGLAIGSSATRIMGVELEWSEKTGDRMARQATSCIEAATVGLRMAVGYVYPPGAQQAIMQRRHRYLPDRERNGARSRDQTGDKSIDQIDHETRLVNALYARTTADQLHHVSLFRMYFDDGLHFQSCVAVSAAKLTPTFKQAIGTSTRSKAKDPDWSEPIEHREADVLVGYSVRHTPSGCWLRVSWNQNDAPDGWSGWTFDAWLETRLADGKTLQSDYGRDDPNATESVPQAPAERYSFDRALRAAKVWFLQQHHEHLASIKRVSLRDLVPA